jgi:hypothetical protein
LQSIKIAQVLTIKPRYLTKSRFKQALECPDKLYYTGRKQEYADSRDDDDFLRQLAKGGMQVGELAKCYFPGGVEVETLDNEAALAKTRELMQRENVTIFEAAIAFENLLVRVDVLVKNGTTLELYEAKSRSFRTVDEMFHKKGNGIMADWKPYVYDIAFQTFVTRKAYPAHTVNGYLYLVDKNSVCTSEGLYQKFLVRRDNDGRYRVTSKPGIEVGTPLLTRVDLGARIDKILTGTEPLLDASFPFEDYISRLSRAYQDQEKLNVPISADCKNCEYKTSAENTVVGLKSGFEECWMGKAHLKQTDFAKPHIFEIWNFRRSDDFIAQRKYFIQDLVHADFSEEKSESKRLISLPERQWLQVERVHRPGLGPYFDKSGLNTELKKLKPPFHFIDFEATMNAIPYLKGLRPYTQLAFQFSRHTLEKDGTLTHGEWIDTQRGHYPNFDFIRNLKAQLDKDNGSIFMYSPYENTVLLKIYDALMASSDDDKKELIDFIKDITVSDSKGRAAWSGPRKMIDMKDWVMDYYYSPSMKGSNSIKVVLPAIINDCKFVREKHSAWVRTNAKGEIENPYRLLPPVFDEVDRLMIEPLMEEDELADGGAAMCAFNLMQYSEMSEAERSKITRALLSYCELDTLAMVMLYEGLANFGN